MSTKKILIDWGGTIIRDGLLFDNIAEKSGNTKTKWEFPLAHTTKKIHSAKLFHLAECRLKNFETTTKWLNMNNHGLHPWL